MRVLLYIYFDFKNKYKKLYLILHLPLIEISNSIMRKTFFYFNINVKHVCNNKKTFYMDIITYLQDLLHA